LTRAGRRRRTGCGSRTFDFGASGSGARGAFSRGLITLGAIQDDWLGSRNRGLQNIVAQIGNRRYLRFQNILTHIGHLRARRNCALENIAAHIGLPADTIIEPLKH
jgi:hypothetical protein